MATEAKEGLLVWRDRFGLGIKGGQVGQATICHQSMDIHIQFQTLVPNFGLQSQFFDVLSDVFPNFSLNM